MASLPGPTKFLETVVLGGHAGLVKKNRELALDAGGLICRKLSIPFPCDEEVVTSMVSVPLPDSSGPPSVGLLPL